MHDVCLKPGSMEENTNTLIKVMNNKYVDTIGHPDNPKFPIDIDRFVIYAKMNNVLIEINNSSFTNPFRAGNEENCVRIANKAKEIGAKIIIGSDAHIACDVGKFEKAIMILETVQMPDELIVNLSKERIKSYLREKNKPFL